MQKAFRLAIAGLLLGVVSTAQAVPIGYEGSVLNKADIGGPAGVGFSVTHKGPGTSGGTLVGLDSSPFSFQSSVLGPLSTGDTLSISHPNVIGMADGGTLTITGGTLTVGNPWSGSISGYNDAYGNSYLPDFLIGGSLSFELNNAFFPDTGHPYAGTFRFQPGRHGNTAFNSIAFSSNPAGDPMLTVYLWGTENNGGQGYQNYAPLAIDLAFQGDQKANGVPAPPVLALMGLGLLALGFTRWRRKRTPV